MARKKKSSELNIQKNYSSSMEDILVMIEILTLELDAHERRFEANQSNGQFLGDLLDVREKIKDVLILLTSLSPEDIEQTITEFKGE